jgi:hypothetical protein
MPEKQGWKTSRRGEDSRSLVLRARQRRPRLEKKMELSECFTTSSPNPSPPRPAGRGEEGGENTAGGSPAPRSRTDGASLQLPLDPWRSQLLPQPPSPPRPAGVQTGKAGTTSSREQETTNELLEGVAAPPPSAPTRGAKRRQRRTLMPRSRRNLDLHARAEGPNYGTQAYIYTYRLQGGRRLSSTFLHRRRRRGRLWIDPVNTRELASYCSEERENGLHRRSNRRRARLMGMTYKHLEQFF